MEKKTFTLQEIADQYNVSIKTIHNWLRPVRKQLMEMNPGCKQRLRLLLPKQVNYIKAYLG